MRTGREAVTMRELKKLVYVTEDRFGIPDYRKPIVWFDKMLVVCGILAGIFGRLLAGYWVVDAVVNGRALTQNLPLPLVGVLAWATGEYFCRTGNRGLMYHHMDLLAGYLDRSPSAGQEAGD
jgi:hypothetical protein